jgi:uncharacterized protein YndB with AHSA1/START domain
MKTFQYQVEIVAPKHKVFETMLHPDRYREWCGAGWPGSFYQGNWRRGETIRFISEDGSGTLVQVLELEPDTYIATEHIAILQTGGIIDQSSEDAKGWIGNKENYTFEEKAGKTQLTVIIQSRSEWQKMFDAGFPAALQKLKEICERI